MQPVTFEVLARQPDPRLDRLALENSMLDRVLARRRGLPILLSVVYIETARRAGIPLAGVGLPGHYLVGHFGADPPLLLDPFSGGLPATELASDVPRSAVRPWNNHESADRPGGGAALTSR